jgi:hydroxymethylpyrimidine/phosphomethylpyrimidine kinase
MARHRRHDFPKPLPQHASNQGTSCTIAAKLASSAAQADTTELAVFRANLPMTVLAISFGQRLIIAHEPSDQCPKQSLNNL